MDVDHLTRLKARDERAVAELLDSLHPLIARIARVRGLSTLDAEDIAAETTFNVLNNLDKIDALHSEEALDAFVHRVARNAVLMNLRKRQKEIVAADQYGALQKQLRAPSGPLAQDVVAGVRQALESLPTAQRMILILNGIEGFTASEIANILKAARWHRGPTIIRCKSIGSARLSPTKPPSPVGNNLDVGR